MHKMSWKELEFSLWRHEWGHHQAALPRYVINRDVEELNNQRPPRAVALAVYE